MVVLNRGSIVSLLLVLGLTLSGCRGSIRSQPSPITSNLIFNDNQIVKLTSPERTITNKLEIPIRIEFSSPVKMREGDIAVSGGTIHLCTEGTQTVFNCTLMPKNKNVSLKIISGTIRNAKGIDAGGSNVLSFVVEAADPVYGLCFKRSDFDSKYQTLRF